MPLRQMRPSAIGFLAIKLLKNSVVVLKAFVICKHSWKVLII